MEGLGDRRPFEKENKKIKKKRVQGAPGPSQVEKVRAGQASVECFYCKKRRHWKRNCSFCQASLGTNKPKKRNQHSVG